MIGLAGIDIGGTKCAVSIADITAGEINIITKSRFSTPDTPAETISRLINTLNELLHTYNHHLDSIGISCGGPLDSQQGLILSPPNLPGWDRIDIVSPFRQEFKVPTYLQNDANAGALAEWKFGAGKGAKNLIFLTFGTGIGAGLILNGSLYSGTNDLAGEVGHVRLEDEGPRRYGKEGSFEGFCSGGGIALLAQEMAREAIKAGKPPLFCENINQVKGVTAKDVGLAAKNGDELAVKVFNIVGKKLGRGLAMLVDILNPEKIIIGSIYGRQQQLLEPIVKKELAKEALSQSLSVCQILPAGLGERIGDYASLSVAYDNLKEE